MKLSLTGTVVCRSLACVAVALLAACGDGGGDAGIVNPPGTTTLSVFAGLLQSPGSRDGVGVAAQFRQPGGAAQDSAGTFYVADTGNHTIRKISPQGAVTTFAGTAGQAGSADGTGAAARFSSPAGLALDAAGNLYVADSGNHSVRKISTAGGVTTVVALPDAPTRLALDGAGGIYVLSDQAVRKVAADGSISTVPIQPGAGASGQAPAGLRFSGIAVDGAGNLLVADLAAPGFLTAIGTVRKVDPQGQSLPFGSAADGLVRVAFPVDIALDSAGNLLVINNGSSSAAVSVTFTYRTLLRVAPNGTQTVIAGADEDARTVDATGPQARFSDPRALAAGPGSRIAVVETARNAVRLVDPQGTVSTLAGGDGAGQADGAGAQARLDAPEGIAAAADGSLYVAETTGRSVRKISPASVVGTWMPAGASAIRYPVSVAVNRSGVVHVSDSATNGFFRTIYTVAAGGSATAVVTVNANGVSNAMAFDPAGNLIVAEPDGIKSVSSGGTKRVVAAGVEAVGLAVDATGTVYSTSLDGAVRVILPSGEVKIRAGAAGQTGDQDGTGANARFRTPRALALGAAGVVYVADGLRIRRVAPDGTVRTIADLATMDGLAPGGRGIVGLAWVNGALFANLQNAVIRIAPVT